MEEGKMLRSLMKLCSLVALGAVAYLPPANAFDFDTGLANLEVVIPTVAPVILTNVSTTGSDASIVLRITSTATNAWFDAIAPYNPTAIGALSNIPRRPASESVTNRNKNIAILYASYQILNGLLPNQNAAWRNMLSSVGLNPDDTSEDPTTPVGIGNIAGKAVVAFKQQDGMNMLGNIDCQFNCMPYADYTHYEPVNTAYDLRFPGRWQPIVTSANGIFKVQQFVTPQYALTKPYSFKSPLIFKMPPPLNSNPRNFAAYKQQVDEVLAASAELTDEQKMTAEMFNNKLISLGFSQRFVALSRHFDLDTTVHFMFTSETAAWDAGIVSWHNKVTFDSVRPVSAIRHIYGNNPITAWGGPGKGTVTMPANQWKSYINTADHPEYPSASACFCSAYAQAARRFLGSDTLGWTVTEPKGSSTFEPGITPATDITLSWQTFTDFEHACGNARFWGGVHFMSAIKASQAVCPQVGDSAFDFVHKLINGQRPQ
jgi:hypothetical protein